MIGPMRLRGISFALALTIFTATNRWEELACPPTAVAPTRTPVDLGRPGPRDRGALWRFERDGRHGYLYGTMHVGKREWTFPGPVVARALLDTLVIAMELDPSDPAQRHVW